MDAAAKIFAYCERGTSPAFWAEPLNAATNLGFILGGLAALWLLMRRPPAERGLCRYLLILNLFVIGIGSFLFHSLATRWASLLDVIPIGVFMLAYLAYALRVFIRLPMLATLLLLAGFAYTIKLAMSADCQALQLALPFLQGSNCLNGSIGYLPALAAMLLIGGWLALYRHPAAPYIVSAGLIFVASVSLRSGDRAWCDAVTMMGKPVGTHFLWHLLNSLVLFLLLLAAIRHGGRGAGPREARAA
jgi:hypothetical protein